MKVYKVFGATGEYEDYHEWDVVAFVDKIKADELCKKLNSIATYVMTKGEVEEKLREIDPNACVDYTGTEYFISELEVETE